MKKNECRKSRASVPLRLDSPSNTGSKKKVLFTKILRWLNFHCCWKHSEIIMKNLFFLSDEERQWEFL